VHDRTRRGGWPRTLIVPGGGVLLATLAAGPCLAAEDGDKGTELVVQVLESLEDLQAIGKDMPPPATDEDFYPRDPAKEELGGLLFHDKILSGNENISCATCHHMLADTGDGLSLSLGEGAVGLGMTRDPGDEQTPLVPERVPRNAPHVFNLGAREFTTMFHDGRVEEVAPGVFLSPAGPLLPEGLDNVLAVQAMFPVTSTTEMAGQDGETPIGTAAAAGDVVTVWNLLANRLRTNGRYATLFQEAFGISGDQITFAHAANAIAAWEAAAFRADNSPFDRYLRGDRGALSRSQKRGMKLFYGTARCSSCHSGTFQTNHQFEAMAMPQIGPGKGQNLPGYSDGHDDLGREAVTGDPQDRCAFRVLSLRNVALTGPWGHDGAYNTLEAAVRHMLDPISGMNTYDTSQAVLPPRSDLDAEDFIVQNDPNRRAMIGEMCDQAPASLSDDDVAALIDFLHALTDPASIDLRDEVPFTVPSNLPVYD
jgi:cytochrome c peroxidase